MAVEVCYKRKQTTTREDREFITKYEYLTFSNSHTEFWKYSWCFCYNFNLWKIVIWSNNTNKMPGRAIECILLTSLVAEEYFVPGGSLFWRAYQLQTFFCLPHTISLSYRYLSSSSWIPAEFMNSVDLMVFRHGLYGKKKSTRILQICQTMSEVKENKC